MRWIDRVKRGLSRKRLPAIALIPAFAPDRDDFETSGGAVQLLSARAGWTNGTGGTPSANIEAKDGYVHNSALYGAQQISLFSNDKGADIEVSYAYNTLLTNENSGTTTTYYSYPLYFWYQDAQNYLTITVDKANNRFIVSGLINNAGLGNKICGVAGSGFATMPAQGTITVQAKNGRLRLRLNNRYLRFGNEYVFPYDELNYSTSVPLAKRAGKVGFSAGTYRYPVLDDISVKSLDCVIDFIDGFVGRDSLTAAGGTATVEISTFGGTPSRWIGRVLDWATGAVIQDWTDLGTSVEAATYGGTRKTIFLPIGGPYMVEAGYVDAVDGKRHTAFSRRCLSGRRGIYYGQSNSTGRASEAIAAVTAPQGATMICQNSSYVVPFSTTNAGGGGSIKASREWGMLDGTYLYAARTMPIAAVISAGIGQPVGIQAYGTPARGIDQLSPGTTEWADFVAGLAYGKGVVEWMIWEQLEGDTDIGTAPTTYASKFVSIRDGARTLTGNPNLPIGVCYIGRWAETGTAGSNGFSFVDQDPRREVGRQQQLLMVAADSNVFICSHKLGCIHADGPHYTEAGYLEMCRRDGLTILSRLFGVGTSGQGPRPTTFTLAANRIDFTIDLDLDGATALTDLVNVNTGPVATPSLAGGLYGYQISINDFTSLCAIATLSVDRSAGAGSPKLVGTLSAAAPAGTAKVRSFYGSSYDDTNLFYGVRSGGNIPIRPIATPLVSP